jgi:phosphatidylglycerophosphate synthase
MISQIREPLSKLAQPIIIFFAKMKIHPNVFTYFGLLLSVGAGVALGYENPLVGFILVWFAGTMDFIDGGVARYRGLDSQKGSFIDSVIDRVSDLAVFTGIIFSEWVDGLTGGIMVGSALLISYVRAKGESVGIKRMTIGIMERAERWMVLMLLLFIAVIVPNQAFIATHWWIAGEPISYFSIGYMILTALCVLTVLQRFIYVSVQLTKAESSQEVQVQK